MIRILRAWRIAWIVCQYFGDVNAARDWFHMPLIKFGGMNPIQALDNGLDKQLLKYTKSIFTDAQTNRQRKTAS